MSELKAQLGRDLNPATAMTDPNWTPALEEEYAKDCTVMFPQITGAFFRADSQCRALWLAGRTRGAREERELSGTWLAMRSQNQPQRSPPMDANEKKIILSKKEALGLFRKNQKHVHTILNGIPGVLIGADWSMKDLRRLIRKSTVEIGGERCKNVGHGLIVWRDKEPVFVECDNKKLARLESKHRVKEDTPNG